MQITKVPITWERKTTDADLLDYSIQLNNFINTKHFVDAECVGSKGMEMASSFRINEEIQRITKFITK